jgi:hypothetical protein
VQSELYIALDEEYILPNEFKDVYEQAKRTRAVVRGFINYLKKYEERKATNREPLAQTDHRHYSCEKYSLI